MSIRTIQVVLTVFISVSLLAGCLGSGVSITTLQDTVIEDDRTWSGVVRISGVVTVKKHAHLTIAPGTRIEFVRIDRDGDAIGDGEILVDDDPDANTKGDTTGFSLGFIISGPFRETMGYTIALKTRQYTYEVDDTSQDSDKAITSLNLGLVF